MKFLGLFRNRKPARHHDPVDEVVSRTVRLADEVTKEIRERAKSPHPFRLVMIEMIFGPNAVVDPALVGDAYEIAQESRIFLGPPNGHG